MPLALWGYREEMRRHARIYLKSQAELPGFWRRNRDQIMVAIGSLILGALLAKWLDL